MIEKTFLGKLDVALLGVGLMTAGLLLLRGLSPAATALVVVVYAGLALLVRRDRSALERACCDHRRILDSAGLGICAVDASGRTTYVNAATGKMTGFEVDDLVGKSWHELVAHTNGSSHRPADCPLAAPLQDGSLQVGHEGFVRKDGSSFLAHFAAAPIRHEDTVAGAVFAFADLSTPSPNGHLLSGGEHFRQVFDEGPVGMALVGPDHRYLCVNGAWQRILGYSEQEASRLRVEDITHPEDCADDMDYLRKLFSGRLDRYHREKRYIAKDNKVVWVNLWVSLIKDSQGKPLYALGIVEDITEAKTLEQQLRQSQKMEAIGRLAGGIAHDFNNLLFVIQTAAEFVLDDLDDSHPRQGDVKEIMRSAERAANLVRQLLAFSRRELTSPQVLDVGTVVLDIEKLLRRTIGEDIRLLTRLCPDLWPTEIDPGHLEQVIMNLAVNARDAMPGGGSLMLETAHVTVDDEFAKRHPGLTAGDYVRLSVNDSGCGMSPEVASHVFEPFFTTKPSGSGTGLGLSTVYGIVKQAGGYITLDSELGVGTTFHVYLPATSSKRQARPPAAGRQAAESRKERLFVVENNEVAVGTSDEAVSLRAKGYGV